MALWSTHTHRCSAFICLGFKRHRRQRNKVQLLTLLTHNKNKQKIHMLHLCVSTMMNQKTFRQREKMGGGRWGHCLWLTQGGSAFKSPHHLHWFPFLRSRGFKDLHSCDVKREKWGRNSRTRAGDGAFLLHTPLSSPTASSLPVTQTRQKAEEGFVRLDSAGVIKPVNFYIAGLGMYVNESVCHYQPTQKAPLMHPYTQSEIKYRTMLCGLYTQKLILIATQPHCRVFCMGGSCLHFETAIHILNFTQKTLKLLHVCPIWKRGLSTVNLPEVSTFFFFSQSFFGGLKLKVSASKCFMVYRWYYIRRVFHIWCHSAFFASFVSKHTPDTFLYILISEKHSHQMILLFCHNLVGDKFYISKISIRLCNMTRSSFNSS